MINNSRDQILIEEVIAGRRLYILLKFILFKIKKKKMARDEYQKIKQMLKGENH